MILTLALRSRARGRPRPNTFSRRPEPLGRPRAGEIGLWGPFPCPAAGRASTRRCAASPVRPWARRREVRNCSSTVGMSLRSRDPPIGDGFRQIPTAPPRRGLRGIEFSGSISLARVRDSPRFAGDTGPPHKAGFVFSGLRFSVWPVESGDSPARDVPPLSDSRQRGRKSCFSVNLRFSGGFRASPSSRLNDQRRHRAGSPPLYRRLFTERDPGAPPAVVASARNRRDDRLARSHNLQLWNAVLRIGKVSARLHERPRRLCSIGRRFGCRSFPVRSGGILGGRRQARSSLQSL
jgi:hypothetical protein